MNNYRHDSNQEYEQVLKPEVTPPHVLFGTNAQKPLEETKLDAPKCPHTNIKIISSNEVKCACGVGWTGSASQIYDALKNR